MPAEYAQSVHAAGMPTGRLEPSHTHWWIYKDPLEQGSPHRGVEGDGNEGELAGVGGLDLGEGGICCGSTWQIWTLCISSPKCSGSSTIFEHSLRI